MNNKFIHALHGRNVSPAQFSALLFESYENHCLLQVKIPIFFPFWKVKH